MALIHFHPATLHEGKRWFISFYVLHPVTGKLTRKCIKFNRIKSIPERRKQGKKVCHDINLKLASGWNPFLEAEAPKAFNKLLGVIDTFMNEKKKECRPDTLRTYNSYTKIFEEWILKNKNAQIYAGSFSRNDAITVMNYLYMERNLGERSYNGFLAYFQSLFNWMVRALYIRENPFISIKKKKVREKQRILITEKQRLKLKEFLVGNDYQNYYVMVLLAFYGLVRPLEISQLKKKYFNMDKAIIHLPGKITKNSKSRIVSLPEQIVKELVVMGIGDIPDDYFLFSKHFKPGNKWQDRREISRFWSDVVRPNCKFPDSLQFYSLRDSGIVQMLKDGVPPNVVRDQADHSSLDMTNKYIPYGTPEGSDVIKNRVSKF
jgi:integrase